MFPISIDELKQSLYSGYLLLRWIDSTRQAHLFADEMDVVS